MAHEEAMTPETEDSLEAQAGLESGADMSDAASLMAKVAELEAKLAEQSDGVLRVRAEMQNIQRRAEQDVQKAHKYALEKFANELLPVVDNLERAVDAAGDHEAANAIKEGVLLTLKIFHDTLKKFGVEAVNPVGEPFNPEMHQAMTMAPSNTAEPNSVLNVFQKGYTLNGRLLRPALVVVAKAP
ncbi:MAG TPA: nucleotide exchange factor GrpE [Pseudomonadales bacterium]|nr:nucleotide exchange factor GrpE [Pseudomonadales bacterium]